jgi:subtilisin family serine protease
MVVVAAPVGADTLSGLPDVTVVDDAIVSLQYEGIEYIVTNGDLTLGTTTRWYIDAGVETLWVEGHQAPAPTVVGTSNPKIGDVGSRADNYMFRSDESNNISSIDGIDFQETVFPFLTDTFFLLERGGNDSGTWQAIYEDGSLGPEVAFSAGNVYADTGVNVVGQNAFGVVFKTDVPVQGVRITASGHDTLSISVPMQIHVIATNPNPADGAIYEDTWLSLGWTPGDTAVSHNIYFGENYDDVDNGTGDTFQGNQTATYFFVGFPLVPFPNGLVPGTTYYWRIDEVEADDTTTHKGDVWSFKPNILITDPDLMGWWKLDDGMDTTAIDSSGNDNHGTLFNGPGWINAQWVLGYDGSALEFDGVDDYVDIPYPIIPASYTISAWVKPAKNSSSNVVVYTSSSGPTIHWSHQLRINESGMFEFYAWSSPAITLTGTTPIEPGTWYSVAATVTSNQDVRLFVNGEEEGIESYFGALSTDSDRFFIGSNSGDGIGWFEGVVDDFRIYERPLSHEEIQELLNIANTTENDFYYNGPDEQVLITIALDRFGAIANEGVTGQDIGDFIESLNLVPLEIIEPGGIIILGFEGTLDREALVQLIRVVRAAPGNLFARTGLIVTPGEAIGPMLLTDDIISQFLPETTQEEINALNSTNSVTNKMANPFAQNQFLLNVTDDSTLDALDMANLYHESPITEYALPNFILIHEPRLNDEFFNDQWHLNNTGQNGGTIDADIDAPEAWKITKENEDVVIAIIDLGFDISHEDLKPNLWTNPGEIANNGSDDDTNTYDDDIYGWNFGDNNDVLGGHPHGTSVAGCAGAKGDNLIGVSGSCPNCKLMLGRVNLQDAESGEAFGDGLSFGYAKDMGADIINCSWGYLDGTPLPQNVVDAIDDAAVYGRDGLGCVIFFAMHNDAINDCEDLNAGVTGIQPDISSLPSVIAVSAASNQDRKVTESGNGNCMELLGPTYRGGGPNLSGSKDGYPYVGTLNVVTTDGTDNADYNMEKPLKVDHPDYYSSDHCTYEYEEQSYTRCFGGTSAASPITAGVAGLILSVDPTLTRAEVQRLLQDTADKIQDSIAYYSEVNGFSNPSTGVATHGYGRVNAFEAVQVVAPIADGGRDGVDIFIRDNYLDWGNTEQPSNTLFESIRGIIDQGQSMDIKVDTPPYQTAPTPMSFDNFVDETPSAVSRDMNRVYVRVRNRGPKTANTVKVNLYWTQYGTAFPDLPSDFWVAFPNNPTTPMQWHALNCSNSSSPTCTISYLDYSGCSMACTAQIVQFDFPAPTIDSALPNQFCLLAMIDSPQDRILPKRVPSPNISGYGPADDFVVEKLILFDNNVTHRNYTNLTISKSDDSQKNNQHYYFIVTMSYREPSDILPW